MYDRKYVYSMYFDEYAFSLLWSDNLIFLDFKMVFSLNIYVLLLNIWKYSPAPPPPSPLHVYVPNRSSPHIPILVQVCQDVVTNFRSHENKTLTRLLDTFMVCKCSQWILKMKPLYFRMITCSICRTFCLKTLGFLVY